MLGYLLGRGIRVGVNEPAMLGGGDTGEGGTDQSLAVIQPTKVAHQYGYDVSTHAA
jgi:hypothetical protein